MELSNIKVSIPKIGANINNLYKSLKNIILIILENK